MSRYYARDGEPLTLHEWAELMEDNDYRRVAETWIGGRWKVSTVWLGLDQNWWGAPPLIFETMVFDGAGQGLDRYHGLEIRRYWTEATARQGHAEMVALVEALDGVREHADPWR